MNLIKSEPFEITIKKGDDQYQAGRMLSDPNQMYLQSKIAKGENPWTDIDLNKEDIIPGGLADKKSPSDFDKDSLEEGVKVELEHTSDRNIAVEIAMDHLTEDPDYYKKLKTIEKAEMSEKKLKKEAEKMAKVHENMDALQKKKSLVQDVRDLIKSYGSEFLVNTHGEEHMPDADKDVLNMLRTIEEIKLDDAPYTVPFAPVGKSEDFGKSGTGAGSRGGKIVGHTRSGKPIYEATNHPKHHGFSAVEHFDAAAVKLHRGDDSGANAHHAVWGALSHKGDDSADHEANIMTDTEFKAHGGKLRKRLDIRDILAESKKSEEPSLFLKGFDKSCGNLIPAAIDTDVQPKKKEKKKDESEKSLSDVIDDLTKSGGEGAGSRGGKVIGQTKSGHPIYEKHLKQAIKAHNSGTKLDFSKKIEMNRESKSNPDGDAAHELRAHEMVAAVHHAKHGILGDKRGKVNMKDVADHGPMLGHSINKSLSDVIDDLTKSGEGSRGGKVTGHTASGKAIYGKTDRSEFYEKDHKKHGYSVTEHHEGGHGQILHEGKEIGEWHDGMDGDETEAKLHGKYVSPSGPSDNRSHVMIAMDQHKAGKK